MKPEFMLDCETLALSSRAAVWQFTIMEIPPQLPEDVDPPCVTFFIPHDVLGIKFEVPTASANFTNRGQYEAKQATVEWSLRQPGTMFRDWMLQLPWTLSDVQQIRAAFAQFLGDNSEQKHGPLFWAKNAAFDFPILEFLFENMGITIPWHYRNKGCLYTMRHEAERLANEAGFNLITPPYSGPAHDSAADCRNQIRHLHYFRDAIRTAHRILAGVDRLPE